MSVTLSRGRITEVKALRTPSDRPRSQEIAATAVPQLTREALSAQSAHIDAVSGATYTSEGYTRSLQSALDKAGV
ncbi:FMN-binding protein [Streptomyces sp. NPDC007983]|uniref:FMN-binding protein n=1 Tax=Streptomyces sp. NPDC007983 TaxID=3364800 RepID=UPI0036EE784E